MPQLGFQDDAPDHSRNSRFRTLLTTSGLAERLFAAAKQQLVTRTVLVEHGLRWTRACTVSRATRLARTAPRTRTPPGSAGAPPPRRGQTGTVASGACVAANVATILSP